MAREKTERGPLIRDIAAAAGVSVTTASNVLSERRQVNSESGRRVLEVAQQMGYVRPKKQFQGKKRIHYIIYRKHGKVVMDTPFFFELLSGIEQACRERKYELYTTYLNMADASDPLERINAVMYEKDVAVLLLATEMNEADLQPFLHISAPLVIIDSHFEDVPVNQVVMDNVRAGRLAVQHLLEKGHTRIGYIGSSVDFNNMRDRFNGFQHEMQLAKLPLRPEDIILVEPTMEGAFSDLKRQIRSRKQSLPTAFFAANDILALSASRAFKSASLRLPGDVSIVGMDDIPMCQIVNPELSTISVPKRDIGMAAVNRLIDVAERGEGATIKMFVNVTLVERSSVAMVDALEKTE